MRTRLILASLGITSCLLYGGITVISRQFNWGEGYADRPILTYLALYFALFALYAVACRTVLRVKEDLPSFWICIAFGLLFRAIVFPANQIQEDDVYRYLWDGKVFAHGVNPYEYAPQEANEYLNFKIQDPKGFLETYDERQQAELDLLNQLKWKNQQSLTTLERVNHPHVPTIYPPMAQHVFRLAHFFQPDSILALRGVFMAWDVIALAFILLILKTLGRSKNLCLIYFWSPLLIKETFNSTHLDIIGVALMCVSIYFIVTERPYPAVFFLALSFLSKLYSAILLPIYLQQIYLESQREQKSGWGAVFGCTALFTAVTAAFYLPFVATGWGTFEGLKTFSTFWQSNDSLFAILLYFYKDLLGFDAPTTSFIGSNLGVFLSKVTVVAILLAALLYFLIKKPAPQRENLLFKCFVLMALVFLLSPVQNPWYLLWVLPFFCLFPRPSWILLTGLIGLYYLDFYFDYQETQHLSAWIPWFEYLPFYALLTYELWKNRLMKPSQNDPP